MKKKKLFCLIFFCFVVIPVFCKNQFTVNKKVLIMLKRLIVELEFLKHSLIPLSLHGVMI